MDAMTEDWMTESARRRLRLMPMKVENMMKYESQIALRYLRSKRKEKFISFTTWAAAVGIAIGVMALIVVIAVMTGFQDEIRDRILGVNPHMLITDVLTGADCKP